MKKRKPLYRCVPCSKCNGIGCIDVPDGSAIRAQRERLCLSLREAARRIGISHVYLSDVESGRRGMTERQLWRLISALDPSADKRAIAKALTE